MSQNKRLKLNIQMFADTEEIDSLLQDLGVEKSEQETKVIESKDQVDKTEVDKTEVDKTEVDKTEVDKQNETKTKETKEKETDEDSDKDESENKGGIKGLREAHRAEKLRAKELQESKEKLEKDLKTSKDRLMKAIRLGIKGETEEEILQNLDNYEVKEKAGLSGLTEEQVRKEAELQLKLENITKKENEVIFNQRAYKLQIEKGLTEKQLIDFINEATSIGINLSTNPSDFSKIYDKIFKQEQVIDTTEKDTKISELTAEIARLRGEKAPENGVEGTAGKADTNDWEATIENMKGK